MKRIFMSAHEKLDFLSNKIKEITNSAPVEDTKKNLDALFKGALTKMALVSREEFDVQAALLIKTQAKLVDLETKLVVLEKLLKEQALNQQKSAE